VGHSDGMDTDWELFSDAELVTEARNAQSKADTLPAVLADPLRFLAGCMLTELAHRRNARQHQT
jgi:hypothetical protein